MNTVVKEIDKSGAAAAASYLYTHHADKMDTFCDSLKVYLQDREPEEIGVEKYGKLIKLRGMLDCKDRVHEDEMDERGRMCPVCTGGRREGYGNDCPNCDGEGFIAEAVVEVPAGLRGEDPENLEQGGATSRDAERFLADLGSDDSVDTEVIDPETGEVLDWPTKDTRRAQDDAEYEKQEAERQRQEDEIDSFTLFPPSYIPYIPGAKSAAPGQVQGFEGMDRAQEDLGKLKWDSRFTDFYDITWKSIEDLVDEPQQYYEGDYDIGWDMPISIKRMDGEKLTDEDHANFRRLSSLFRAATYNIGIGYAGGTEGGTVARFYPSFY